MGSATVLARIVQLMRDAQASRAPIQQLADSVSAVFMPTVMTVAAATIVVWLVFGGEGAAIRALAAGVAVLIIACPCAMGLAVPTAAPGKRRASSNSAGTSRSCWMPWHQPGRSYWPAIPWAA